MGKSRWIAHNTNDMPKRLKDETFVIVCFNDMFMTEKPAQAHQWRACWKRDDEFVGKYKIIAYQIIEDI